MISQPSHFASGEKFADWLLSTEVGDLLRTAELRELIAQEHVIDHYRPFVETPDLLVHEEDLLSKWSEERASIYVQAETLCGNKLSEFQDGTNAQTVFGDRIRLRMATYRRLDAWHTGQDKLTERPHSFAGELYVVASVPEIDRPIKVGQASWAFYDKDPRKDEELLSYFQNEDLVTEIEYAIFPLAGRSGLRSAPHWQRVRAEWRECAPLRQLEATTRHGAFPRGIHFQNTPCDLKPRVAEKFLAAIGPATLIELGLSGWWPAATEEFINERIMLFTMPANESMLRNWCIRAVYPRLRGHAKPVSVAA